MQVKRDPECVDYPLPTDHQKPQGVVPRAEKKRGGKKGALAESREKEKPKGKGMKGAPKFMREVVSGMG